MNKYEFLTEIFNQELGNNYNIVYHNDESIEWKNILIDNMIHGVLHATNGTFQKINGLNFSNQQLTINLMIPAQLDVFSEAVMTIEQVFKTLHNQVFEFENEQIQLMFNYISDSTKTLINGVDYANIYVNISIFTFENAIMGNSANIEINGQQLDGVIKASFSSIHTADGVVKANQDLIQKNRVNAIQRTLVVDCVVVADSQIITDLMRYDANDITYLVKYNNGIVVREMNMYVVQLIENYLINDTAKLQITFGIKE